MSALTPIRHAGILSVADVVFELRSRGVRLWVDNNELHYETISGGLAPKESETLRALRTSIIEYLQRLPPSDIHLSPPPPRRRSASDRVPLTFAQQYYWNVLGPDKRSFRLSYTATQIYGTLNIYSLRQSVLELLRRHESLRTRIIRIEGSPVQVIDEWQAHALDIIDLRGISRSDRESEARRLIKRLIFTPIELSIGPLFDVKLIRLEEDQHVLVTVLDHLVSDGTSESILWREIWAMYAQCVRDMPIRLPAMQVQFPDYAVWQHKTQRSWADERRAYWSRHLAGARRVRLFACESTSNATHTTFGVVPVRFGDILSQGLRELSRREGTTLALLVFSAYVSLVFQWCKGTDLVVPFMTHGRVVPEVKNLIGCFACPLYLRIQLAEKETFLDLLRRVTREYGSAYGNSDLGVMTADIPWPEFSLNPLFNWIPPEIHPPTYTDNADVLASCATELQALSVELNPEEFTLGDDLIYEAIFQFRDTKDGVLGSISYSTAHAARNEVERFERNLRVFARSLVSAPNSRIRTLLCVP
jgi:Condensation domain/TubC N-terminal docking domain